MDTRRKDNRKKSLMWNIRKRYRWARLNWPYVKQVLLAELGMGDEIHAC